jgi:hypothetical protein
MKGPRFHHKIRIDSNFGVAHGLVQIARDLPEKVKSKIVTSNEFGVRHGIELLRLKDKPEQQQASSLSLSTLFSIIVQGQRLNAATPALIHKDLSTLMTIYNRD